MAQSDVIATKLAAATNWALWRCNESSGNLADASGNGFTLTARGTPTYSQTAVEGTGILFDGTGSESATAIIAPIGSSLPDTFTMGFNVKGSPQASKCLLSVSNGTSAGVAAFLTGTSAGVNDDKLRMQVQTASTGNVILSVVSPTILDNTWHHVVAVGSGGNTVAVYVDGVAQTPLSGIWSSSRPGLVAAAIAGVVLNQAFPQAPSSVSAITVENVFMADIALAEADVVEIYNAGAPDTEPPELLSATIAADGETIVMEMSEIGSPPLLPATGITGFTVSRSGVDLPIASVSRTGNTQITATMESPIHPGIPVLLSYSGGNVTDSSSNALEDFDDVTCVNNSVTETYAKISMLSSASARMAPHTVFVTAAAESVPIGGDWRYCSATWNFGDGAVFRCVNPVTMRTHSVASGQNSWACASHTYETPGTYTISLTLIGSDGVSKSDTTTVTVVANTRTTKYLDSSADPGGDGSEENPWSTHAEMVADLVDDTTVLISGSFDLTETTFLPAVSNVWFKPASTAVTFHWTSNPASNSWVFGIPAGAENILVDGRLSNSDSSRGIVVTSDVGKSVTKNDNQTGLLYTLGDGVKVRNVTVVGDIDSGGLCQGAVYGGTHTQVTHGIAVENCTFGDCNNHTTVFTRMEYVCFIGTLLESAWIEHTQRWLSPASRYISHQWNTLDHKRVNNGTIGSSGQASKTCIRAQSVEHMTVLDCILTRGVLDISYPIGTGDVQGPGYHIQYSRCVIDDCGIYLRPNSLDVAFVNCYIKETPVITDMANVFNTGNYEMQDMSFLHNTFVDMSSTFSFLDFSVQMNTNHDFPRSGVEVAGNLFCTATGQTGDFIRLDDVAMYTIFDDIINNVMTDGLSVYVRSKNATTQSTTDSFNWATFTGDWPDNTQDTIAADVMDALTQYRPSPDDNPDTVAAAAYRTDGILSRDLFGNPRPGSGAWYAGAVDIASAVTGMARNRTLLGVG